MNPVAINIFSAKGILRIIIVWTIINVLINGLARLLSMHLNDGLRYMEFYFSNFFSYIAFQSFYFGCIFAISACISRNKVIVLYAYSIMQFIALHLVFFYCLKTEDGVLSFITDMAGIPLMIIDKSGTDISYTLAYFLPIEGLFDGGIFWPYNLERYYFLIILVPILYNFFLTWLTDRVIKIMWKLNSDKGQCK